MNVFKYIVLVFMLVFLCFSNSFAGPYSDGEYLVDIVNGDMGASFDNPILIEDVDDLIELSQRSRDWDKFFRQTYDIVFADSTSQDWDGDGVVDGPGARGFEPIGNEVTPFSGGYDGGNNEIDKLYFNDCLSEFETDNDSLLGLFGFVNSVDDTVKIKNLGIGENSLITACNDDDILLTHVGSIVAYSKGHLKIDSSYNKANHIFLVYGLEIVSGGLVGYADSLTISNSYNLGDINPTSGSSVEAAGGLVGHVNFLEINNSYNTGVICSDAYYGGLVGRSDSNSVTINSSYNEGNTFNESYIFGGYKYSGGLVGYSNSIDFTINDSYNSGDISSNYSGGLVGKLYSAKSQVKLKIKNSYNNGNIYGIKATNYESNVGGLVGMSDLVGAFSSFEISNSYNSGWIYCKTVESSCAGLVGESYSSDLTISNSYNSGSVYGANYKYDDSSESTNGGGLIGYSRDKIVKLNNNYSSRGIYWDESSFTLQKYGGLVGNSLSRPINNYSFYDTLITGLDVEVCIDGANESDPCGVDFNDFKLEATYTNKWQFNESPNDEFPWIYDSNGRPYLYWQEIAISNSNINNYTIEVSIINTISIQEKGLRYHRLTYNEYVNKEIKNSMVVFDSLEVGERYFIQPYVLSADGNYYYGDEFEFTPTAETHQIIVILNGAVTSYPQEITFTDLITEVDLSQTQSYTIVASSTSSEEVAFTSLSEDVCEVSGSEITFKTIGTCKIKAEVFGDEVFASYEENFEIDVDNSTDILSDIQLNFNPVVVDIYTLKGELIKSKYCSSLSEYRMLINSLTKNEKFSVK